MKEYPNHEDEPIINKLSDIDLSGVYSYANYIRWEIDERLELIKGKIYKMAVPSTTHQVVSRVLAGELYVYLKNKTCQLFSAPFDVRLTHQLLDDKSITTVVQPDICIVCDTKKIDTRGCIGAPDLIIEILSPGNNKKELELKYNLYEEFGVKEYWLVQSIKKSIIKHVLNEKGKYECEDIFASPQLLTSNLLPGFTLSLEEIFNQTAFY